MCRIFASNKPIVITLMRRNGHVSKDFGELYLYVWEVSKLTSPWVKWERRTSVLNGFQSDSYLLNSNLGHWHSISLLLIFQYSCVCAIKKNTTASQGRMSFRDESSDSHVLVYKLLTALGFIGMKDALFIVLWDERCIIYKVGLLFYLPLWCWNHILV